MLLGALRDEVEVALQSFSTLEGVWRSASQRHYAQRHAELKRELEFGWRQSGDALAAVHLAIALLEASG